MKENKYDDDTFFEEHSRFPRSAKGLSAAGEWHELKKTLPAFKGKRVLDIGCGFGWHCIYAAEQLLDTVPDMRDELRRPMMLIVSAKKKSTTPP